jgi:hypothetical protein
MAPLQTTEVKTANSRNLTAVVAFALSRPLITIQFVSSRRDWQSTQYWLAPLPLGFRVLNL